MKRFKIGAAVLAMLVAASFVVAFAFPTRPTIRRLFRATKTAQTVDAIPIDVAAFSVPDNSVMHVQMRVSAIELATGEARTWNAQAGFKRFGGILSLIGNKIDIEFEAGDPTTGQWEGSIEFDDATDELCVRFQGRAGETIEWFADFEVDLYQP